MDKLKKCGQMWIKFDENNAPEYGFKVKDNQIEEFLYLSYKKPNKIILPDFCKENTLLPELINIAVQHINNNKMNWLDRDMLTSYFGGQIKLMPGCFKNVHESIEIIVPFEHSMMICDDAFDENTKQKFILKDGMEIFDIGHIFSTGYEYGHKYWALIGRKEIKDISFGGSRESYRVSDFEPSKSYNFEIDHMKKEPEIANLENQSNISNKSKETTQGFTK